MRHPAARFTWGLLLLAAPAFAEEGPAPAPEAVRDEATWRRRLEGKLGRLVSYRFDGVPFRDAVAFLESQTGTVIHIDKAARDARPDLEETPVHLNAPKEGIAFRSALNALARAMGLAWTMRDETLVITTVAGAAEGPKVTVSYDIRDVALKLKDFPGPRITLKEGGQGIELTEVDREDEADAPETLVELVKSVVDAKAAEAEKPEKRGGKR